MRIPRRRGGVVCALLGLLFGAAGNLGLRGQTSEQAADETPAKQAHDWPTARGNALNNGVATSSLPARLAPVWEFNLPNGAFPSAPAIVDDGQRRLVVVADADGKVRALQLDDGALVWEFAGELGFVTAPAYCAGRYFIGDVTGIFYCLDREGREVWRFVSDGQIDSSANFFGDHVMFGSQDSNLYCLNRNTGELVWKVTTGDQVRCAPTIIGGRVFAAGCDGYLHIIDATKGEPIAKVEILSPTGATPAALGDLVYFGTEQEGFLAVDWQAAAITWQHRDERSSSVRGNAAVTEGHVVFATQGREAMSLDPATGTVRWATTLRSGSESSPVIVGERVFLPVTSGRLYELKLSDGAIVNEWELRGRITASPAVGWNRLVIGTERGVLTCFGPENP